MSVEKMEQYKEYKKHRKEILRKQKRRERLYTILGISSVVLILGLVCFLVYQDIKPNYAAENTSLIDWSQYIPDDIVYGEDSESEDAADGAEETSESETTTEGQE